MKLWRSSPISIGLLLTLAGCAVGPPAVPLPRGNSSRSKNATESIDLVADASVKDSLARRNDVKFGAVKIDGEKTDVALSTIAAESVSQLEVTQAPTPDLDAESTGGLLNIQTKPATSLTGRTLKASTAFDWSNFAAKLGEDGSVTFGDTFGKNRALGLLATATYEQTFVNNDAVGRKWSPVDLGGGSRYVTTRYTTEAQVRRPRKLGFNGTLDYKWDRRTSLYFRINFNDTVTPANNRLTFFRFGNGTFLSADAQSAATRGADELRTFEDRHEDKAVYTIATGGAHHADKWSADFRLSRNIARTDSPRDQENEFIQRGLDLAYRLDNAAYPTITAGPGQSLSDPARITFNEVRLRAIRDLATDSIAMIDVKVPRAIGQTTGFLKFGAKLRIRVADHLFHRDIYTSFAGNYAVSDVLSDYRNDAFLSGHYPVASFPEAGLMERFLREHLGQFGLDVNRTHRESDPASYRVDEDVAAGYALGSWQIGRTHLLAGVRTEQTGDRYTGYEVLTDTAGNYSATNRLRAQRTYLNVFPGLHLVRPLTRTLTLAASLAQSITRPAYTDLVPSRAVNRTTFAIVEGNPQLAATTFANFDVSLDWNPAVDTRVVTEFLHQQIAHTIFPRTGVVQGGLYDEFELSKPGNGGGATLNSVKLRVTQKFSALPGALGGLGFAGTFYYRDSSAEIPGRPGERLPLAQTPRQEEQLSLIYESGKYYGSVDYSRAGRSLQVAGRLAAEDTWYFPLVSLNATFSYKFRPHVRLFADLTNLGARPLVDEFYGTTARRNGLRFDSGSTARVGCKFGQ